MERYRAAAEAYKRTGFYTDDWDLPSSLSEEEWHEVLRIGGVGPFGVGLVVSKRSGVPALVEPLVDLGNAAQARVVERREELCRLGWSDAVEWMRAYAEKHQDAALSQTLAYLRVPDPSGTPLKQSTLDSWLVPVKRGE
jgi:hypothetical protein